jgi:hypothetical protein
MNRANMPRIRVGRLPGIVNYKFITLNDKDYVVGTVKFNGEDIDFVFDRDDYEKVNERAWHVSSGSYIASTFYTKDNVKNKKELYMHNLIMGRLEYPGKGAKETVDHINRIGFDNRKENLRIVTQSEQNMNQTTRTRNITLPEGCELVPEDIPRHIWYIKANGEHGDRFAIEFKTEGLCWKTTSSRKISLKEKLQQAKEKLQELYTQYPHLNPFNTGKIELEESLKESYNKIIELSLHP